MREHNMETDAKALQADVDAFGFSDKFAFLLENPMTKLPDYYQVWMDLASNLTHLIKSRRLRDLVQKMPELSPDLLTSERELRLAHLSLACITMGYVWQEGQHAPAQTLPKALAVPFWLVSQRTGLPPILTNADIILANWKLKDPKGDMEIGNMDLIFSFPGGEDARGFILVTMLVELAGAPGLLGVLEVMHAMKTSDLTAIQKGLDKVMQSLKKMKEKFKLMHAHVSPTVFFEETRIFFSGWKNNPSLPKGLLYEGVSDEPVSLSSASGVQSSILQCFDALLRVEHEDEPVAHLTHLRDYMPPLHRQLIDAISALPSLRDLVISCSSSDLCQAYNACVSALVDFRSYHLTVVAKYITVPSHKPLTIGCPFKGEATLLNTRASDGSRVPFLKSLRDATKSTLISEMLSVSEMQT